MVANGPGIISKSLLVTGRAGYYPFTIPKQLNDASYKTGSAINATLNGALHSAVQGLESLEPKGPAKWAVKLLNKFGQATERSQKIGDRNKVLWDPITDGVESIGRGITGPFTLPYHKALGVEPTADSIKGVLNMKLFHFPDAGEMGGSSSSSTPEPAPAPDPAPASDDAPAETKPTEQTLTVA